MRNHYPSRPGLLREGSWMDSADCQDSDPSLFFDHNDDRDGRRQAKKARAICMECPVRRDCLDYAINNHIHHGMWGGTTETERRRIARVRRDTRKATS